MRAKTVHVRLTAELLERIVELSHQGLSKRAVAAQVGISFSMLNGWVFLGRRGYDAGGDTLAPSDPRVVLASRCGFKKCAHNASKPGIGQENLKARTLQRAGLASKRFHDRCRHSLSLYFLLDHAGHEVKIGVTTNIRHRISTLNIGRPRPVQLLALVPVNDRTVEQAFHAHFSKGWVIGEWFTLTSELRAVIAYYTARPGDVGVYGPRPPVGATTDNVIPLRRPCTPRTAPKQLSLLERAS